MTASSLIYAFTRQPLSVAINVAAALLLGVLPPQVAAQDAAAVKKPAHQVQFGEVIYIPVYSHIVQAEKASRQKLSSTLVIHNADPSQTIQITSVRYYDHAGTQIENYVDVTRSLGPFASANFVVDIRDDRGGVGANFIVEWQAAARVVSPIVEAIMTGGAGTQGLSFITRGKAIETRP